MSKKVSASVVYDSLRKPSREVHGRSLKAQKLWKGCLINYFGGNSATHNLIKTQMPSVSDALPWRCLRCDNNKHLKIRNWSVDGKFSIFTAQICSRKFEKIYFQGRKLSENYKKNHKNAKYSWKIHFGEKFDLFELWKLLN